MSKNKKFALWLIGVALFSITVGSFFPSGPVNKPKPATPTPSARGRGAAPPVATKSGVTPTPVAAAAPAPKSAPAVAPMPSAPSGRYAPVKVYDSMTYSELLEQMEKNPTSIDSLTFENGSEVVTVLRKGQNEAQVVVPQDGGHHQLRTLALKQAIRFTIKPEPVPGPNFLFIIGTVGTFILIMIIGFNVLKGRMGGGGMLGILQSPGRSIQDLKDKIPKVKFKDVAGCDEAVKEMARVIKGLVGADVYKSFGGELPGGVLLVGPPGTGKTLLAKAAAGECDGTMDVMSGSDFVMMFVGVGAGRVRDTFAKAVAAVETTGKPHIIFIDEIDAVGGKRGGGAASSGSNQEREQTLNQLLVEMDGVVGHKGILIMAATNRVDMLDEALLRPGRFDCQVQVDLPDVVGREALFAIYTHQKPVAADVSLATLAARSFGYSGAEIRGACNRAAIIAAERWVKQTDHLREEQMPESEIEKLMPKAITLSEFDEGIDHVRYGNAEPGKQANMSAKQKENTAVHEAGHANATDVQKEHSDPAVKITILRRRGALGYVQQMPETDRVALTMEESVARIVTALSGRAAQVAVFKIKDSGVSNDLEQANHLARQMVTRWGMSRLGHIFVGENGASPLARSSGGGISCGPEMAAEIDKEVRRIVEACYSIALKIVTIDEERIRKITALLMKKETILVDEWKKFVHENPSKVQPEDVAFDPTAPAAEAEGK